jgi:CubicO group peptidase (beta-lactamase class C family)
MTYPLPSPSCRCHALSTLCSLIVLVAPAVRAQAVAPPSLAGHWKGALKVGVTTLDLDVEFTNKGSGWTGDISIPAQGAKNLPLQGITVEGDQVDFTLADVHGNRAFKGKLAADGSSIKGTFTQAGESLELSLSHEADPIADMKKSLDGFDEVIKKAIKDFKVPGLAIAVVKDGEVIYAKGFGQRNIEKDLPVTPRTLFAIGSCTKAFTTFVMGALVEEGKLEWDTPVRTYLPEFRMSDPIATESLTPRDMATHRSGLPRHDMVWRNSGLTGEDLVPRLAYLEPTEPLRSRFQYNNIMFMVAGYMIETIDRRPWEEAVRARIFQPLGMGASNFSVRDSQKADDHATPYDDHAGKVRAIPFLDITNVGACGAINSNVTDMARWMVVHTQRGKLGGKSIISPWMLAELHTPQTTMDRPSDKKEISAPSYALGWMVGTYRGHRSVWHTGRIDGFTCETRLFPDDGMGIVILNNKTGSPLPGLIAEHAADRLLGLDPIDWLAEALEQRRKSEGAKKEDAKNRKDSWRRSGTQPAHPLEEYAGDYEHPAYGQIKIEHRNGRLVCAYNGNKCNLEHWHFDVFNAIRADTDSAIGEDIGLMPFQTNVKGYVDAVAVTLERNVKPIVFTKQPDRKLRDPEYLKRFAGEYEHAGETTTIRLRGNALFFEQNGARPVEMVPDRDDGFNLKHRNYLSVRFVTDTQGKVVRLDLIYSDEIFPAMRKP